MKTTTISLVLYVLSVIKYSFSQQPSKLLFVQLVWRHGDRAPNKLYKNDPNPPTSWPEGLEELTQLGKKQHYELGKYLHKRYDNFTSFTPQEIKVVSAQTSRCMMSALANLATFFAPGEGRRFEPGLDWQPIPVDYVPKAKDKLLEVKSDCPRAEEESKRLMNSPEQKKLDEENKAMYADLARLSGDDISDSKKASKLRDTIEIEKKYGLEVPPWIEPLWEKLCNMSDISFHSSFNSPVMHRLRGGPLLKKIIEDMDKTIAGKSENRKFVAYSGHDSTIVVLLTALDLYDYQLPPYCATLLFELHEMPNEEKAVRILYLNSTKPEEKIEEPHTYVLKGCEEFCPLKFFVNFTKDLIPDDWEKECQSDQSSSPQSDQSSSPQSDQSPSPTP